VEEPAGEEIRTWNGSGTHFLGGLISVAKRLIEAGVARREIGVETDGGRNKEERV
jgi:hypothetical protein